MLDGDLQHVSEDKTIINFRHEGRLGLDIDQKRCWREDGARSSKYENGGKVVGRQNRSLKKKRIWSKH